MSQSASGRAAEDFFSNGKTDFLLNHLGKILPG
jgi:hypothetical protein